MAHQAGPNPLSVGGDAAMTRPIPSYRELGRRPGRDEAPTSPVPVHPGSDGHDVVPIAGILRPVTATTTRRTPPSCHRAPLPDGPLRRLRARSAAVGGRPTASAARVVRRAPILSDIPGEYVDPEVPGFVFVSTDARTIS